jgi:hypothetical protein
MRKLLAVLLAGLFLILFLVAVTVNQVVDTASDPDVITGMLNDAEIYDYVYDDIIGNLVHDMVDKGIEIDTGLDDSSAPTVLHFSDTDAAALAITDLIESLLPREYVREKIEESLNSIVPYISGDVGEFTIDLETQDRVRAVPAAVRQVVSDLDLTERVTADLLVPQFAQFADQISGQVLGIDFTQEEIEANTRLIFAPDWLEDQVFGAIDEVTPYFTGDADSFDVSVPFDDRVVIAGEIIKDKLKSDDALYNLVFNQVVDPLIQQTVAQSTEVGFGISLTEREVVDAFEVIAPRDWVRDQGEGVIDALIGYLVGDTSSLAYFVDLSDRKIAATVELQSIARKKLESTLAEIPACGNAADALSATQDIASQQLPRCVAGGQQTIDLALGSFGSVLDAQVESFVDSQVPGQVSYTEADFEAQVGGGQDTIEDLRRRSIEGFSFSVQDLIDVMAEENDPQSRADAEELLRILADGVLITERNILENLDSDQVQQFDDVRGYVGTALTFRWILWVLVLIPLVVIAYIGGGGWAGRLKWAGGVAAICGVIAYGGIAGAWAVSGVAESYVPDYGADVSAEFRADYPRLSAELESSEFPERFTLLMDSWQQGWRNQTVPWIIGGVVAFAAGTVIPLVSGKKTGTKLGGSGSYKGSAPSSTGSSAVFSIPKDWGDGPEDDEAAEDAVEAGSEETAGDSGGAGDETGSQEIVSDAEITSEVGEVSEEAEPKVEPPAVEEDESGTRREDEPLA